MSDLKELFAYRLSKYRQTTDKILQSIPNVTEGVLQALSEDESSTLEWEDVQYEPETKLVILIGVIQLDVGEHIQLEDGNELHVTDENVDTFKRIVRVGIPYALAESGSVEDVVDFFADNRQTNYAPISEIAESMDEIDDFENITDLQKNAITSILGFNIDGLSDEQIQQIVDNLDEGKIHCV